MGPKGKAHSLIGHALWPVNCSFDSSESMKRAIYLLIAWLSLLGGCTKSQQSHYVKYLREGTEAFTLNDFPAATVLFMNASKALPKEAEPYYQLGLTATASGDTTSAVQWLKQAVELNPKHVDAKLSLADLFARSS